MAKTIIISNRLPVTIKSEGGKVTFQKSSGGLASGLSAIMAKNETLWIGWPGAHVDQSNKEDVRQKLRSRDMLPVFLTQKEMELFYEGFSNSVAWPNFHYFNEYVTIDKSYWQAYEEVNQKFFEVVRDVYEPGDRIWIHDYHLMLLPKIIRQEFPESSSGFFLHIPFPDFETFRIIPWREEILEGLLGADLVGFQTYDDAGHFMECAKRLLGVEAVLGELKYDNRVVAVDAFPIGIDFNQFAKGPLQPATITEIEKLKKTLPQSRFILCVDRLDYSKGIRERLNALDIFFEKYPQYREQVYLLIVMIPSRDRVKEYKRLKEEIDELVGKLNGKYSVLGWNPVHYLYKQVPFKTLSALYAMSDVALVTPLRDGMNLVCKEYVASRTDHTGALVLSERAGAARTLTDAIRVNPDNIYQMADALHEALSMELPEQKLRMQRMQQQLKKYDIFHWADLFMNRLDHIKHKQSEMTRDFNLENLYQHVLPAYEHARKKLLLLDYDGTLVGFSANPQDAVSDQDLHDILNLLLKDPTNHIYIVTGRDRGIIEEWFPDHRINIVAEHGVWLRKSGTWERVIQPERGWESHIKPILELYVDRTPGSLLEEKENSFAWHYRNTDKTMGELRARELSSTLGYLTANLNLQVLQGNKVIEVKSSLINKGITVRKIIDGYPADFIMAMGDDTTDEDMFRALPDHTSTIKVGYQQTEARFKIHSWREVRALLKTMSAVNPASPQAKALSKQ